MFHSESWWAFVSAFYLWGYLKNSLWSKVFHICAMIHLYYPTLRLSLWEQFIGWTFTCNYLHPAVLTSPLHLITPAPSTLFFKIQPHFLIIDQHPLALRIFLQVSAIWRQLAWMPRWQKLVWTPWQSLKLRRPYRESLKYILHYRKSATLHLQTSMKCQLRNDVLRSTNNNWKVETQFCCKMGNWIYWKIKV